MNQKLLKLSMTERRELLRQLETAHRRGLRFDAELEAEVRASLVVPPKPIPQPESVPDKEPTLEQMNRMLKHFGNKPIKTLPISIAEVVEPTVQDSGSIADAIVAEALGKHNGVK